MLCLWGFKHTALCLWRDDQINFWSEKQAGRFYLHFYKIYSSHLRCTLAHELISLMFAKRSHSVGRVKRLARSMAHAVILGKSLVFKRCLDSNHNSQCSSGCLGSRQKPRVSLICSVYLALFIPKGLARTCQQACTLTVHLCTVLALFSYTDTGYYIILLL